MYVSISNEIITMYTDRTAAYKNAITMQLVYTLQIHNYAEYKL